MEAMKVGKCIDTLVYGKGVVDVTCLCECVNQRSILAVVTKSSFFSGRRILKEKTKFVNSFLSSIAQVRACLRVIAAKKVTKIFNKLPLL